MQPQVQVLVMYKFLQNDSSTRRNQLLSAFEPLAFKTIEPNLERVYLKLGDVVCEAGGILRHAYFPEGSVLSLLTVLENGDAIETSNIGREGAFGLFAAMRSRTSFNRCIVQLAGPMVRCRIEVLEACARPFFEFLGNAVVTGTANRRLPRHAQRGGANVPLAFNDARPGRGRSAYLHP
jgi:hypothetical protein